MEHLPIEVIGNILSRLRAARDIVIASTTCKKWHRAWRSHVHSLSFSYDEWPDYRELSNLELEILITQIIFQTPGLQDLHIFMNDATKFSAAPVIAWLMYTRETLRQLHYNVRTYPKFNIIEKCGRHKLEELVFAYNSIVGVEPSYQKFPCLRLLSLTYVSVSALDLCLLLTVCPKIETLVLICPDIVTVSDAQATMELTSSSLKDVYIETITLDKFILDADSLEKLHLKECTLELFELIGKGSLKVLKIDDVSVLHFDIGENAANLEVADVSDFTIKRPKFYNMFSRSLKLTTFRLWDVVFADEDDAVDLETMPVCFPHLTHLSMKYDVRDDVPRISLDGSSQFNNVVVLELGWSAISDHFVDWVAGLLAKCPKLKRLVIYGVVSEAETRSECQILASFTSTIVRLMRKYMNVEVQFEYE